MSGINPYTYMQEVSLRLPELNTRREIEPVLDKLEYLFEVIPPRCRTTLKHSSECFARNSPIPASSDHWTPCASWQRCSQQAGPIAAM